MVIQSKWFSTELLLTFEIAELNLKFTLKNYFFACALTKKRNNDKINVFPPFIHCHGSFIQHNLFKIFSRQKKHNRIPRENAKSWKYKHTYIIFPSPNIVLAKLQNRFILSHEKIIPLRLSNLASFLEIIICYIFVLCYGNPSSGRTTNNRLFKVNNRHTRTRREITPALLLSLLLTLNMLYFLPLSFCVEF